MSKNNDESQERIKQIIIRMLKTLDKLSKDVDIYGEHVGPFKYPMVRVLHECKEGTHVAVEDYDYDVRNENRIDYESLHRVYEILLDTPEFKEFESALRDHFGDTYPEKSIEFLQTAIEGNVNRESMITRIVEEILEIPVTWTFNIFIQGLIVEQERFEIGDLVLRKLTPTDFNRGSPWDIDRNSDIIPAHTVVEWTSQGIPKGHNNRTKRITEVIRVLTRLRLVKGGLFKITAWTAKTPYLLEEGEDSILLESDPLLLGVTPIASIPEPVLFDLSDQNRFIRFQTNVFELMENVKNKKIEFALKMLNEAAWKSSEEALLFCVIGLESLFLINEQELRQKLATRVTVLLKNIGADAESVYDDIWTSYGIRNKFVHGSFSIQKEGINEDSLISRLAEYLRESIVVWIQLFSAKHKNNDLIAIIDRALISVGADKQLKSILKLVIN